MLISPMLSHRCISGEVSGRDLSKREVFMSTLSRKFTLIFSRKSLKSLRRPNGLLLALEKPQRLTKVILRTMRMEVKDKDASLIGILTKNWF